MRSSSRCVNVYVHSSKGGASGAGSCWFWTSYERSTRGPGGVKRWTGGHKTVPETNIFAPKKIGRKPNKERRSSSFPIHFQVRTVSFREGKWLFSKTYFMIFYVYDDLCSMAWSEKGVSSFRAPPRKKQRKEVQRFFQPFSPLRLFESYNSRVWMMRLASSFPRFLVVFFGPL